MKFALCDALLLAALTWPDREEIPYIAGNTTSRRWASHGPSLRSLALSFCVAMVMMGIHISIRNVKDIEGLFGGLAFAFA